MTYDEFSGRKEQWFKIVVEYNMVKIFCDQPSCKHDRITDNAVLGWVHEFEEKK